MRRTTASEGQPMINRRYFACTMFDNGCVIDWHESCLIGDAIAEIVGLELLSIVREHRPKTVVMKFGCVNGISSSVIGCLLKVQKELARNGGRMRFVSTPATMLGIFRTLNLLGTYFVVASCVEDALGESPIVIDAEMQIRLEAHS